MNTYLGVKGTDGKVLRDVTDSSGLPVSVTGSNPLDSKTPGSGDVVALMQGFNGATWDRQRLSNKYTVFQQATTAATTYDIWTPSSGKKFRLLGFIITFSVAGYYEFRDSTGGIIPFNVGSAGAGVTFGYTLPGNGILGALANNKLRFYADVVATVRMTVFGTEE